MALPNRKLQKLQRQAILAVVVYDISPPASLADGQLRRSPGTLGLLHDLLSQLAIAKLSVPHGESLRDVRWFY